MNCEPNGTLLYADLNVISHEESEEVAKSDLMNKETGKSDNELIIELRDHFLQTYERLNWCECINFLKFLESNVSVLMKSVLEYRIMRQCARNFDIK